MIKPSKIKKMALSNDFKKIVLVGNAEVGKTTIINKFIYDSFDDARRATIGAAFFTKAVETEKGITKLQIWDTAGQERFRSVTSFYYQNASCAVIVFDLTKFDSLNGAESWYDDIQEKSSTTVPVILVGNKCDLIDERQISKEQIESLAKEIGAAAYVEVSAKSGENVNQIFRKVVDIATHDINYNDNGVTGKQGDGLVNVDNSGENVGSTGSCC